MQAALDSTALMLSKDAQTLTTTQLATKATAYFNALFHRPEASNVQVTQQFSTPAAGQLHPQGHRQRDHQHHVLAPDRAASR